MTSEAFYKLKVVDGLHKDAELFVEPEAAYRIGSGDECDIVLLDTGVETVHLAFRVTQGQVRLESAGAPLFVDGQPVTETPSRLSSFQVVSIGQAHLAFGPADEAWPAIAAPKIEADNPASGCLDLIPVNTSHQLPKTIKPVSSFKRVWQTLLACMQRVDRKILAVAGVFLLMLGVFIYDAWQSSPILNAVREDRPRATEPHSTGRKSFLLSAVDGMMTLGRRTMVDAWWTEPVLPIQARFGDTMNDPVDHIRNVLKSTWGANLMESRTGDRSIQFKGYDELKRQDLLLNLEPDEQGHMNAEGVTLTLKKKKAILGQLGDIIRVKVDSAEDMENACQRMLEKKGIRKAKARFDIQDNTVTLQGQSDDHHIVATISDLIAKAFPEIRVNSDVKVRHAEAGKFHISGVCTSGAAHVILKDGNKVFKGGRLDNGCTIVGITADHIMLDCHGVRKRQDL